MRAVDEDMIFSNLDTCMYMLNSTHRAYRCKRSVELTHRFLLKYGKSFPFRVAENCFTDLYNTLDFTMCDTDDDIIDGVWEAMINNYSDDITVTTLMEVSFVNDRNGNIGIRVNTYFFQSQMNLNND